MNNECTDQIDRARRLYVNLVCRRERDELNIAESLGGPFANTPARRRLIAARRTRLAAAEAEATRIFNDTIAGKVEP